MKFPTILNIFLCLFASGSWLFSINAYNLATKNATDVKSVGDISYYNARAIGDIEHQLRKTNAHLDEITITVFDLDTTSNIKKFVDVDL